MTDAEAQLLAFMVKREKIRRAREAGSPWPWTDDPILREYKFTNVHRKHDRVSRQYEGWYKSHDGASFRSIVYNAAFARYFGRPEFVFAVGWQNRHDPADMIKLAREWINRGEKVFTGAYMVTNLGRSGPKEEFVANEVLSGVWDMAPKIVRAIRSNDSWQEAHGILSQCLGFGGTGFMGKEVLIDTMYTPLWGDYPHDWNTWCPVGPGALRGLNRVAGRPVKKALTQAAALPELVSVYDELAMRWPAGWEALSLHDVQFQLCEFDKYERARLGEGRPRSKYKPKENTE